MNHFLIGKLAILLAVFGLTAFVVARSDPPFRPVPKQRRLQCWQWLALTTVVVLSYATCSWIVVWAATIAAISLVIRVVTPYPLCWQTIEMASTATWLTSAIMEFSNLGLDLGAAIALILVAPVLCWSWVFRTCLYWSKPETFGDWTSVLLVPASAMIYFGLLWTGLAANARLAVSEPALRAFVLTVPPGFDESYSSEPRRVGLLWADEIQERERCVLWTLGGSPMAAEGLAFIPGQVSPSWDRYRFEHIRGAWWRFEH